MPPTHTDEGLVAASMIRAEHPEIGVLILSQYIEPSYAMRLLEDHPERVGYLRKERIFDVAILIDALRRLADRESVIDPTILVITQRTVEAHVKQIFLKLNLDTNPESHRRVLAVLAYLRTAAWCASRRAR